MDLQVSPSLPVLKYSVKPDISEFVLYKCVPTMINIPYIRPEYVCTAVLVPGSDLKPHTRFVAVPKRVPEGWHAAYLKKELVPIVRVSEPTGKSRNSS
jgi:hypothetical protein